MISSLRLALVATAFLTLGITGCSEARRVRPQAKASPAPRGAPAVNKNGAPSTADGENFADAPTPFGEDFADAPTREERRETIRTEKATAKVLETFPEGDVSAEEVEKRVKVAESEITDEEIEFEMPPAPPIKEVPETDPSPTPGEKPKSGGGLLTDNTKTKEIPAGTSTAKDEPKVVTTPWTPPSPKPKEKIEPETKKPEPKEITTRPPPNSKSEEKPPTKQKPVATPPIKKPEATNPIKKPEPNPPVTTVDDDTDPTTKTAPVDDGIDEEDRKFSETYDGPKEIVDYPTSTREYQLSEIAAGFGKIRDEKTAKNMKSWAKISRDFLKIQIDRTKLSLPSCNFFFPAALIDAGAPATDGKPATKSHFPLIKAEFYETAYFGAKNSDWIRLSAKDGKSAGAILKEWFRDHRSFDVAIQRDAPKGSSHGHIAIPIGLNDKGLVMVAQASYKTVSNQIVPYSDNQLAKFRIFVRYDKNDPKFR